MDLGRQGARAEGPRLEARRTENGGGVLGEGQPAPSPPARWSGSAVGSPAGSGAKPRRQRVFPHFKHPG